MEHGCDVYLCSFFVSMLPDVRKTAEIPAINIVKKICSKIRHSFFKK